MHWPESARCPPCRSGRSVNKLKLYSGKCYFMPIMHACGHWPMYAHYMCGHFGCDWLTMIFTSHRPQLHSTKKVSSRLTLFDITQEVFHLLCSFKSEHKENFIMHSLQFIVIFIIKTSGLLSRELRKKVALLFNGAQCAPLLCACCFCAGISMSRSIEAPYRPIILTKSATFFLLLIS